MSVTIAAALAGALLVPASPVPPPDRPTILALNPQPEPPGRGKIKRIYTGGPDSRRGKTIKQQPMKQNVPAAKY
jgi:hypothetical protein